jgi:hypothetical protein
MSRPDSSEPVYCSEEIVVLRAPSLTAKGWEQRTVTDPSRIAELEELYSSLGFETTTTGLDPSSFTDDCNTCAETACATYLALFTRRADTS